MIRNERLKLLASLLNTMAGSSYAIGVAALFAAAFYNAGPSGFQANAVISGAIVWIIIACMLHLAAQRVLGGLK